MADGIIEEVKEEIGEIHEEVKTSGKSNKDIWRFEKKGWLDAIQERILSRKLLVFIIATAGLWVTKLDAEQWTAIAMVYIGSLAAVELARAWKNT